MVRYIVVSVVCGVFFGAMDGIIHANPFARRMLDVYQPIAKTYGNIPAGILIDLFYGFILGFFFLLLYKSLPGRTGLAKGIAFALIVWFLRIAMNSISSWMMFVVPAATLLYLTAAGLLEMLLLGIIYGIYLRPLGDIK